MLDLDKHLEKWFEVDVGDEKCKFLLRYYSPEKRIEHKKESTVRPSKGKPKLNENKYVAKMLGWVIQDWEEIGGECNDANRKRFAERYGPTASELLDISYLEQAFREHNTVDLLKNFAGLSFTPNNGEPVKVETNQD